MSDEGAGPFAAVVADDVPEHLEILTSILGSSERFEVVETARTGTEVVSAAARCRPDLVLLDIGMPEMDGLEALPMIRAASPTSKVVIVSGQAPDDLRSPALGAVAHLAKDLPPAVLIERLLEVMRDPSPLPAAEVGSFDSEQHRPAPGVLEMAPEEMVSVIAHEVRNHLAVIQGFGGELHARWGELPEDMKRDSVRRMTERARYLNAVVNNLMVMRRLESGHVWKDTSEVDVEEFITTLLVELEDLARGHQLVADVSPGLPKIAADPHRMRQVLTNLVVNAARFSPADAPIVLSGQVEGNGVILRVTDNGPGIPEAHQERVFEKFTRLEDAGSGIGLGLFISRELMRSMDGDLRLEQPRTGSGATFALYLPVTPAS